MDKSNISDGEEYRSIFENATEGVFRSNTKGRFLKVNLAMARIYGYDSPDEMVNSISDIAKQIYVDKNERKRFIELLMSSGFVEGFEGRNLRKDGSVIWTSTSARAEFDEKGRIVFLEGFVIDISSRKRIEEEIKDKEARYRALVEGMPAVVFLDSCEEHEITHYISPQIKDLLGYTTEEWIADDDIWEKLMHPDDREAVLREDKRTDKTGETFRMEYRLRKKDDDYLWIREETSLIRDDSGRPLYWQGFFLDINDFKSAEQTLVASEERFRNIFTATPISICLTKLDSGRLLSANPAYWELTGLDPAQALDHTVLELGFYKNRKERNTFTAALKEHGKIHGVDRRFITPENRVSDTIAYYDLITFNGEACVLAMFYDVSEKKQFEKSLKNSEANFRDLFDSVNEAIYILDAEGRFLDVNEGAVRMYGHPREFFIGKTPDVIAAPGKNDLEEVHAAVRKAFQGKPQKFEFWGLRQNGEIFPKEVRLYKGSHSEEEVIFALAEDITERKEADQALRESEARYRSLAEASNDMIYIIAPDGTIEYVNSFAARQFNVEPREMIGRSMDGMFPGEVTRHQEKNLAKVRKTGKSLYVEEPTEFPDQFLWLGTWLVPLMDDRGKITSVMGVSRDITERKAFEGSLQESEQRLRAIIENTNNIYYSHSADHKLTFLSPQTYEILGYKPEEALIDWHLYLSNNPANQEGIELTQKAIDTGKPQKPYSLELIHKDGHPVWVEVRERPILQDGRTIAIVGALTDITERKRSEEQLNRQLEELKILHQVALAATLSQNTDELIEQVTEIISQTLYPDNCGVELLSEDGTRLRPHSSYHGASNDLVRWESDATLGVTGKVTQTGKALRIADVTKEPAYIQATEGIRSELCVPIKIQDQTIGVVNVESRQPDAFNESDERLLVTIAGTLAIGIQRSRLFENEQKRRREAETLREITSGITTYLDSNALLQSTLDSIARFVSFDSASIALLKDGQMEIVAGRGFPQGYDVIGTRLPQEGKWTILAAERHPLILADAQAEPGFEQWEGSEYIRGWMGIPLFSQDQLIGSIYLDSKEVDAFKNSPTNLLQTFANSVAVAIEKTRLFASEQQNRHRAEILRETTAALTTTFELEELYQIILDASARLIPYKSACIELLDQNELTMVACRGLPEEIWLESQRRPFDEEKWGHKSVIGEPFIIANATDDPRMIEIKGTEHIRSWLGVPLISQEHLIGFLNFGSDVEDYFTEEHSAVAQTFGNQVAVAIENARLYTREQALRQRSAILLELMRIAASSLETEEVMQTILNRLIELVPSSAGTIQLLERDSLRIAATAGIPPKFLSPGTLLPLSDYPVNARAIKSKQPVNIKDTGRASGYIRVPGVGPFSSFLCVPLIFKNIAIGLITLDSTEESHFTGHDIELTQSVARYAAIAIENARLFEVEQGRRKEAETLRQAAESINSTLDIRQVLTSILDNLNRVVPFDSAGVFLIENDEVRLTALRGMPDGEASIDRTFPASNALLQEVLRTSQVLILKDAQQDPRFERWVVGKQVHGWMGVPLIVRGVTIGFITIDSFHFDAYQDHDATLAMTFAHQAATALENARLFERGEKQIRQLTVLRDIDSAISSSFDLKVTLNILLNHASRELNASSANILLYNPESYTLSHFTGIGMIDKRHLAQSDLRLGEGLAGKVIMERKMIHIHDLQNATEVDLQAPLPQGRVIDYFGLPLIGKGQIKGVLEVYTGSNPVPDQDWLNFLQTLAGQAAIAIDNVQLFRNLQRSNQELSLAYDTTLEGWARALELRDKETEGHSHRVVDMTIDLARRMGIEGEGLTNLKRGTLLHDIGKMGVPDEILHKAGPLSEAEWKIMRQHPNYAYELLQPISYLRQALDIPFAHHERWDGSGYPRGLKTEAIPLPARIFAVVDVWDALLHERSYRNAWNNEDVLEYLQDQAGKEFDPEVVQAFLQLLKDRS